MSTNAAASITKSASTQTYYTIRFLVDRERVEDAYRAYGYCRWVDDTLDGPAGTGLERRAFVERQKSLLEQCYRGQAPRAVDSHEELLVALVRGDRERDSGLQAYLRHMLRVMDFDTRRRGQLISQAELNEYTRWLAIAVTEALHYFIGHGQFAPRDETRYLAVSAAHIAHMLRDTYADRQAGYFNIPREVLDINHIGPDEIHSDAYRAWVRSRLRLARDYFQAGQSYFARVQSARHRLAGLAYIARFTWLLDTIEREDYHLRPQYSEGKSSGTGLRMAWRTLSTLINLRGAGTLPRPAASHPLGKS